MPYSNNSGGPWGGGGGNKDDKPKNPWGGGPKGNGQRPTGQGPRDPQVPDLDDFVRKGQEQLKVLMGGKGGSGGGSGLPGGSGGDGSAKGIIGLGVLVAIGLWGFASTYTVQTDEKSVELLFGEQYAIGSEGLNFAPWPVVTYEKVAVTQEQTEDIGVGVNNSSDQGLMLTGDENIVDIDFQVVWNISDPAKYLFNLQDPRGTVKAVSESAMREVIGRSELAPILNRDRAQISQEVQELIQNTLDVYDSGINVVRLNFDRADPPPQVRDAFRDVQAAEQDRDTLEKQADAYANRTLADARGEAAQLLQEAEAYRAQVVNEAQGEASRFSAVYEEYAKAPDVTRRRLYLETMEKVLGNVDKVLIDSDVSGDSGVVPYLPLNELKKN